MDGNDIDDIKRLLERRNNEINIIEKVASKINKSLDMDAIANTMLASMHEYFDFEHSMILLVDQNEIFGNEWKYFASYAEVLNKNKIISDLSVFEDKYKNPDEFCCLLTKVDNNSKIIFIPYPED